jgi:squalene-associated FAD-dependent desaturase
MNSGTVYVVGAGLSGLAAAVFLAAKGVHVELFEASGTPGGRCRSYYEPALGQIVDNGNHLILSGNHAVHDFLHIIGSEGNFSGPDGAEFAFADLKTGARWTIRANDGVIPWWALSRKRRVPGTHLVDYLGLVKLLRPVPGLTLGALYCHRGPLWRGLLHPFLLAALNTEPETASASLAAVVIMETLLKGGKAYTPRIASPTLAAAFIDPAVAFAMEHGAAIRFGQRLLKLVFDGRAVTGLEFAQGVVWLSSSDTVILAAPPAIAASLVPELVVPDEYRAIVSAHFGVAPPPLAAPMTGVLNATVEWILCFQNRVSVTVSNADRLIAVDRVELAGLLWRETAQVLKLSPELPPWQVVKEKRATFAATPDQEKKRPGAATQYGNLFLAGDWTNTKLPATIEGAVRSGRRAADLALARVLV